MDIVHGMVVGLEFAVIEEAESVGFFVG